MAEARRETVTFLFTDIEGSTKLLDRLGERYPGVLEQHRQIVRAALREHGGVEHGTEGDSFFASFDSASAAVEAAVAAQRGLAAADWPDGDGPRVRMGMHTGEARLAPSGWVGIDVHRAARISDAGHGGQILLSRTTRDLVVHALPEGLGLRDLGEHRLKDLAHPEQLYQVVGEDLRADFPPLRSMDAAPNNLPSQLTSFVGRDRQVAEARELLGRSRLLTLVGPGGTGKTRLSLRLAVESLPDHPDGVWFVALAPVRDPELVASTILSALGLPETGASPAAKLLEHVRDRGLLLILDNFEQVLDAAPLVADLLRASDGLRVVVTSRAALHVAGEQEYAVPPLSVPPDPEGDPEALSQYESVSLFAQRAMAVMPEFRIGADNASAVAEICARLDGLPLAIELAAARVKLLPPQALLSRLAAGLDVLASQARDLPPRQRTLRGAIAWSHELLEPATGTLFARLSVFRGGWPLELAEAVCGLDGADVLAGLDELVDHSLVRQVERAGQPRFLMLETIREYAQEQLEASGEEAELRARHAQACLELAEAAEPKLMGPEGGMWLDRLEGELDNFRAALDWAVGADCPRALRLGAALWRMWQMRGHLHEGRRRLDDIVSAGQDAPAELRSRALEALGGVAYWQADMEAARVAYDRMLAIERELGADRRVADGLYNVSFTWMLPFGVAATDRRNRTPEHLAQALRLLEEALAIYQRLGADQAVARCLWAIASCEYEQAATFADTGQPEDATKYFTRSRDHALESLAVFERFDDWFDAGWAMHEAGIACIRLGELDQARGHLHRALELFAEHRDVSGIVLLLDDLAELAVLADRADDALRLRGGTDRLRRESGAELAQLVNDADSHLRPMAVDERSRALWDEGTAMSLEAILDLARTL